MLIYINVMWYQQALSPIMQAVLGVVSFKATEHPSVIEPITKLDKVLEETSSTPIDTSYTGTSRSTKQEQVVVAILMNTDIM